MTTTRTLLRSRPILLAATAVPIAYYTYHHSPFPTAKAESPAGLAHLTQPATKLQPKKVFNGSIGFVNLVLESSEQVNHDTKRLRFKLPGEGDVSGVGEISALLTKANINGSFIPTVRPYSPTSSPDAPGHVDLLVKHYPTGAMSSHLHSLQPGQTHSFFTKPISEYAYKRNMHSHAVLVAGGAGITPLYQLAAKMMRDEKDETKVTVVFGVNTDEDLLFRDEFARWQKQRPDRFKAVYAVTNSKADGNAADTGALAQGSEVRKGRVTAELLKEVLPGPSTEGLKIFLCGPPAMEEAVAGKKGAFGRQGPLGGVLKELGYESGQVHKI